MTTVASHAQPSKKKQLVTGVIVVTVLLGGFAGCTSGSSGRGSSANRFEAIRYCEDKVKSQLKAPSTAKFSTTATDGKSLFTVTGTVDSANSFGAMLRANFRCTVTINEDTFRVSLDQLG